MKRSRCSPEQIAFVLRQAAGGRGHGGGEDSKKAAAVAISLAFATRRKKLGHESNWSGGCRRAGGLRSRVRHHQDIRGESMTRFIELDVGDGETAQGVPLDFEIDREEWNRYKLLDGGTVRVKTTVTQILRVVNDEGQYQNNADGTPEIVVTTQLAVVSA